MEPDESHLVRKEPCPECGSRDNLARYSDGHGFCFGCGHYERGDGEAPGRPTPNIERRMDLLQGELQAIPARNLTRETCERYNYRVGEFKGGKAHLANYYDETGKVVAQKVRYSDEGKKAFKFLGAPKEAGLFGQQLCREAGKMVVITEGEIDALSVSQAMGNKWPVVSLPNGAQGAKRDLSKHVGWLSRYETVVLCFDMDPPGRAAVEECVDLFPPGKVKVAHLVLKDANELVKANRSADLANAIWSARTYQPEAIVDLDDIMEDALEEAAWGVPWPWRTMTRNTYGIRRGALYVWGAGTGSGKTTLMKQLMAHAMRPELGEDHTEVTGRAYEKPRKVASLFFEEQPKHTLKTLGGMVIGKRVHVPGVEYDRDAQRAALASFKGLFFPIRLRSRSWAEVQATIRYLVHAEGIRDFFIDPMTALVATAEDERRALDGIMAELASLAEELDITIHLVSHLSTPEGKSHEDGGRIAEKHFRGSRAVAYWAHFMMGLERNKQDPSCPTVCRGLKDRLTGDAVGPFIAFTYDRDTGRMVEAPLPTDDAPSSQFKDETEHADI